MDLHIIFSCESFATNGTLELGRFPTLKFYVSLQVSLLRVALATGPASEFLIFAYGLRDKSHDVVHLVEGLRSTGSGLEGSSGDWSPN